MNWEVRVAYRAKKELKKFPKNDAWRVVAAIESLTSNPYQGDIEKLSGEENSWRRRVGDYRIFYEIIQEQRLVDIFKIERRTSSTY